MGNASLFSGNAVSQDYAKLQAPAVLSKISYTRQGSIVSQHTTNNGTMMDISVEIIPGEGRVLVETKPLMGLAFQQAANTAVQVAASKTKTDLSGNDVIVSINSPGAIPEVDGPSAGALMTAVMIAAIEHHDLDQNVTLTGTIDSAGHVGAIGGVLEKAQAAKQYGKTLILIPQDNSNLVTSERTAADPDRSGTKSPESQNGGCKTVYRTEYRDSCRVCTDYR